MIIELNNHNQEESCRIWELFQIAYAVEAKILGAIDFPPLKRTASEIAGSDNDFFGYLMGEIITAAVEIRKLENMIHIQSLVVNPKFFRMGIARKIMNFVLNNYESELFMVETGLDNLPAIELYKSLKFIKTKEFDTDHGIRKVRYMFNKISEE